MSGRDVDIDLFRSLEQALHRPEIRASRDAVAALLADSFVEFGSSGRIYDKATVIDSLAQETSGPNLPLAEVFDFAAQALAPDTVLVTYRSVSARERKQRSVLRSSIWRQIDGTWQMVFHQGTVVPPSP
ncbi:MAG: hypothetical protein B7Z15_21145 [Rhizobiales bacterium 32-66-8]|nr:MAG: hypothetical protein B7Z15_21145 [Rhizobiales bacterium 32-66-8]